MKSLKIKLLFVAFFTMSAIGISLISCNKDNNVQSVSSATGKSLSNSALESNNCEALSNGDIDLIGIMHNELLDKIISEFDYSQLASNDMVTLSRNAFINTEYQNATKPFKETTFDAAYAWQNQGILTGNMLQYMNLVTAELESQKTFPEIAVILSDLRTQADNDANLTDCERQNVKIGISVALSSAKYWFPEEYGGTGQGHQHLVKLSQQKGNGTPSATAARSKAGNIAGADAIGGASGGIEFSIGAIFGGPVGVGAFVGAIVYGAVSSSLVAWAMS